MGILHFGRCLGTGDGDHSHLTNLPDYRRIADGRDNKLSSCIDRFFGCLGSHDRASAYQQALIHRAELSDKLQSARCVKGELNDPEAPFHCSRHGLLSHGLIIGPNNGAYFSCQQTVSYFFSATHLERVNDSRICCCSESAFSF